MPQSPNLHTSPQMEAVLLAAKSGAFADTELDDFALAKALDKGWIAIEGDNLKLTAQGSKVCEMLKL